MPSRQSINKTVIQIIQVSTPSPNKPARLKAINLAILIRQNNILKAHRPSKKYQKFPRNRNKAGRAGKA